MRIEGGKVWWFPVEAEDHVQVTDDVISYEVGGELRLAEPMGGIASVELHPADDLERGDRRG